MDKHEQFRLRVGASANRGAGEPGEADFAGVRISADLPGMAGRPQPAVHVPEARGTDHLAGVHADRGKRHRSADFFPRQRGLNVLAGVDPVLRHGAPAIKIGMASGGSRKAIHMPARERFQSNVATVEHEILHTLSFLSASYSF